MKVLVADDDEAIRSLVTHLFHRRGDLTTAVNDGEAAIARLDQEDFDLLVLDLMMPRVDGLGVLAHLAARSTRSPQIIVMTAAIPSLAAEVPRDQVTAVVTKPFEIAALMRIADDVVRGKAPTDSTPIPPVMDPA
ncbi:MAG: response regulator [Thermoanaerobaculia bacterium]